MPKKIIVNSIGVPEVVEGEPRPMMPDVFIDWIEPRLQQNFHVFEWGFGCSTIWFAERVSIVITIEHHALWARLFKSFEDRNIYMANGTNDSTYESLIDKCGDFELVIVDGVRRNECIRKAVSHLGECGVIILDNSDTEAMEGQQWLIESCGFSVKRFTGTYAWSATGEPHSTTIFYRQPNCLGL